MKIKTLAFDNTVATDAQSRTVDAATMEKRDDDIALMVDYWDQTDAIMGGIKTMRAQGDKFLPRFENELDNGPSVGPNGQPNYRNPTASNDAYSTRLRFTKMTNVFRDIVENLASKPFEQEVSLSETDGDETSKPPEPIVQFIENVDGAGANLTEFASRTFFNGITSAIDWIFVDYPTTDANRIRTIADAKRDGLRTYWSHVLGRNVYAARVKIINGKETLIYIKIFEPGETKKFRIFQRDETSGAIIWELWAKSDRNYILENGGTLSIDVIPLVPFATGRRDGRTFYYRPAMQDAADLQIQLYQDESALKWSKTLTGYAMLAGNGITPEMMPDGKTPKPIRIGPARVLYSKPNGAGQYGEWKFIEPAATSLKFLSDDIKDTMQQLRELGRQPLTAQSSQLTVITTAVAAGKARSAVAAWAFLLKNALENAMVITAKYEATEYDPQISVYTEFEDFADPSKDLDTLNTARKNGDLSRHTYWKELKRRKTLSEDFDADAEDAAILDEVPDDPELDQVT